MSYTMHFIFFTDASRQQNAERLFNTIKKETSAADLKLEAIDPYHKGGHTIRVSCPLSKGKWEEAVFEGIQVMQSFSRGWVLNGSISESVEAILNDTTFSGINMISVTMKKK